MFSNSEQIQSLIKNRRSVKPKYYIDEKVPDSLIYAMLESAKWAPTHGLTEPWKFFVYTGKSLKIIATFLSELYKNKTAQENYNQNKFEKIISGILNTSHIIFIGLVKAENSKIPMNEEICAVACAVQNMQLVASANKIGCYWSTGSMSTSLETKLFLGLSDEDLCLGMLYIGNYTVEIPIPMRTDIEHKLIWNE